MDPTQKPSLTPLQIVSLCVGAFGIQFGFALPQANATRIFQNLGATLDSVPLLWLAGPITGLIVQPLVGYYSDRTWTRYGRRRPYFLVGAALAAFALLALPNAMMLWTAVLMLWLLDASLNLTMGPFRAYVADQLPPVQRSNGYVAYMSFASLGAVVGSILPWAFAKMGVSTAAPPGEVSNAVTYGFVLGATLLLLAVCWSAFTSREYAPEVLDRFDEAADVVVERSPVRMRRHALLWLGAGLAGLAACYAAGVRPALYVLGFVALAYGAFLLVASRMQGENAFTTILGEMEAMSGSMRWLAVVQFFSWFTLLTMFMYTGPALSRLHFGGGEPGSASYEDAVNWAGVLFATYNGFAVLVSFILPTMVRRLGMKLTHRINLWIGAVGLLSMMFIRDSDWLLASMVGVAFAWASIIALPYAMLANNLPSRKMGVSLGIFNIFIVIPQLLVVSVIATLLDVFAGGDPAYALVIGAVGWFLAGLLVSRVKASS